MSNGKMLLWGKKYKGSSCLQIAHRAVGRHGKSSGTTFAYARGVHRVIEEGVIHWEGAIQ